MPTKAQLKQAEAIIAKAALEVCEVFAANDDAPTAPEMSKVFEDKRKGRISPNRLVKNVGLPDRITTHLIDAGVTKIGQLRNFSPADYKALGLKPREVRTVRDLVA